MSSVTLDEIVFDESIYPRATWSQATVDRYADALNAGEHFPPIVLEAGTRRLLDGKHRVEAHRAIGRHFVAADMVEVPEDVPPVLFAASLSARHGDPLAVEDKRTVARKIAAATPDYSMVLIAKQLGVTRQTVSKYVSDIVEHRRDLRRAQAVLLTSAGWSNRKTALTLGVDESVVRADVKGGDISPHLSEEILREAAEGLPVDAEPLIAAILAERAAPEPQDTQTPDPPVASSTSPAEPGSTSASADATPTSALAVNAEQRQQIVDDAERVQSIDNARRKAERLIPEVSALITEIVSGVRYGEPGLITPEMVAGLRAEADRLEQWMEKQ